MGNLSFHSQSSTGTYTDHAGSSSSADSYGEVTIHHETRSISAGIYAQHGDDEHGVSQYGMDAVIYKVTKEGVPISVFGVDSMPADGILNASSVNGVYGGLGEFYGIDAFAGESDTAKSMPPRPRLRPC